MRNLSIDYLKVILAFLVLVLHSGLFKSNAPAVGFMITNGICRIAVPLFLLINGYYFFYIQTLVELKKWLLRLSILYVVWMSVYSPFWFDASNLRSLKVIAIGFYALWYFPGVIIAGVMLYMMRNVGGTVILVIATILYTSGFAIQFAGNIHIMEGKVDVLFNWTPFYRNALFFCFPCLALGFVMKRDDLWAKVTLNKWHVIAVLILVVFESIGNYTIIGAEPTDLMLSLPFASVIIMIYAKGLNYNGLKNNAAMFSVAIFLIHPLWYLVHKDLNLEIPKFAFASVMTLLSALILVAANKKIKYLL